MSNRITKKVKSVLNKALKVDKSNSEIFPSTIVLDTGNYCNLRCSMCARQVMTRKSGRMEKKIFEKIVDEISMVNKNTRIYMNFYGEPLTIKKLGLYEMIAYAKKKQIQEVLINTNANLLDEDCIKHLIDSGLDEIHIGIDACTSETYDKIRVKGDFNKVVRNTKKAIEIVRDSSNGKPKIVIQFIEMEENISEKDTFIEYWKKNDAIVMVRPKVSWMGAIKADNLTQTDRQPCNWITDICAIHWNGNVALCGCDYDGQFIAGNVNDESLQSIWQGKLKEIRAMHKQGTYNDLPPICRDCKDWQATKMKYYLYSNTKN